MINPDDFGFGLTWRRLTSTRSASDKFTRCDCPRERSGAGTVFYRGVDADFATQRDVSRTKRDIKTFEVRLRVDNADRALSVGMTAYVTLRLAK